MTLRARTHSPGSGFRRDPAAWVARLSRELREAGVPCSTTESVAAARSLICLDRADPLDLFYALRCVFTRHPSQYLAFDRCFWRLWHGGETERQPRAATPRTPGAAPASGLPGTGSHRAVPTEGDPGRGRTDGRVIGAAYSPLEALARRSFDTVTDQEMSALDAWLDRLLFRLRQRRSRRLVPGGRRGLDVRRTLRAAHRTDGELLRLSRRQRRVDRPRVVLLCDVSGSMERYSRFLVRFLLASGRLDEVETFAFSTRLTHLSPWLARTGIDEALAELNARGWSSGTRIGRCLEEFIQRHGSTMLGQRTVVLVLSDGLDQGETEPLERAMRTIQRRSRRVIWLNPLMESSRYAPEARGMRAALPFVDDFASGHSLEALERLPELIRL